MSALDVKIARLSEVVKKLHDLEVSIQGLRGGAVVLTPSDIWVIERIITKERNTLVKRQKFYAESQRRRDVLRVANGPDGEGRDRAMARLGLTPR